MPKPIPYRLYNEDCFETFERLGPSSIDMVMVDPPYGTTACKWDTVIPLEPMWKALKRIVKPNGAMVFTASQPFTSALVMSNLKMFKYDWVWDKVKPSGHLNAKIMPMLQCEIISIFGEGRLNYFPQGLEYGFFDNNRPGRGDKKDTTYGTQSRNIAISTAKNYPRNLIRFPKVNDRERTHPTQKPVALMEYLINTYTNEGEAVLDFAMGSGTTGVACMNLGRRFIGCDNDTEYGYFEIARKRIAEAWQASQERGRTNA